MVMIEADIEVLEIPCPVQEVLNFGFKFGDGNGGV
jgi:hypothetical protein